jgi:hypothetical protein
MSQTSSHAEMKKKMGQLLYLTNLKHSDYGKKVPVHSYLPGKVIHVSTTDTLLPPPRVAFPEGVRKPDTFCPHPTKDDIFPCRITQKFRYSSGTLFYLIFVRFAFILPLQLSFSFCFLFPPVSF